MAATAALFSAPNFLLLIFSYRLKPEKLSYFLKFFSLNIFPAYFTDALALFGVPQTIFLNFLQYYCQLWLEFWNAPGGNTMYPTK